MNRKIAALSIAAVAVLGLTACGGTPSTADKANDSDKTTASEAPAESTAEQSVADACKAATEDITAATTSMSELDIEAATADPQTTLDTFTATTDAIGEVAASVNNAEVKESVTAIYEDFGKMRDLLSAVLVDQDMSVAADLTTVTSDLQASTTEFYELCAG
ncbi:hypothetical protein OED01_11730 [Microbacterium sp. M28]|uniref:hypothetical protein n=1 Tax=Microbacterium sp. M28 TaxID=2962064 RepID=UPI0021F47B2D|nr:hypothetical protein [Microbacterium sp. M28]UYO96268.1 hypothetical protein OED01_11730 [Microbacterium sp. M28]